MTHTVKGFGIVNKAEIDVFLELSCYLLGANYGGSNEDNGDFLQKIPCVYWVCPTLQQAATNTHLHWRLLETHRQVWVRLFWGHCSFLLDHGAQCSVCALQVPISQSCVSSGSSMVGLMATSSKRAYAIPKSAAPRAPVPVAVHCWPLRPQEMLKHSSVSVSVGSLGTGAHKVCLSPLSISGGNGICF